MNEITQIWPWHGLIVTAAEDETGSVITLTVNTPRAPGSAGEALEQMVAAIQSAASADPVVRLAQCAGRLERAAARLDGAL